MKPLQMWLSPLTNRIYVGRATNGLVSSKQDVTARCVNGAVAHLVATGNTEIVVTLDGDRYRVTIEEEKR